MGSWPHPNAIHNPLRQLLIVHSLHIKLKFASIRKKYLFTQHFSPYYEVVRHHSLYRNRFHQEVYHRAHQLHVLQLQELP